ncbi:MAG: hypothetical protein E7582_02935 [Ruminococcaceae bacterium]|nr:hypothetical protein [Oscillospiraceae bacterium]
MNYIKNPNLPENTVKCVLCDSRVEVEVFEELTHLGIDVLTVPQYNELPNPICAHPDIHCCHTGGREFVTSQYFSDNFNLQVCRYFKKNKLCEKINNRVIEKELKREYPNDVYLNAFVTSEYIICNAKLVAHEIIGNTDKKIIHVNQGYVKCSILPISDNAFITDDISIYNSAKKYFDVLYVEHGDILLEGYNYGFIGGSGGKISKDALAFFGDLKTHKNHFDIKKFCNNHNVQCVSLSNKRLYDYGSLIPLFEQ